MKNFIQSLLLAFFVFVINNQAYAQDGDIIFDNTIPQPGIDFFESLNLKSATLNKTTLLVR